MTHFKIKRIAVLFVVGVLAAWAGAVPPAPGQPSWAKNTCHVNTSVQIARLAAAHGAPALAPPTKNYNVLVVRVQFSNKAFGGTDHSAAFFQQVQDYYNENSYGVFRPTFTISSVFTLSNSLASYGNNCGQDVSCNVPQLIADSVAAANPSINFNGFDQVMIYHAGNGEESTGTGSDIWSMFIEVPFSADGKSFVGATIVPELESGASALGVICHEYGHQLGLPDLYDTSVGGGHSTVGAWDLMDYPWTGSPVGANPPHLGAWSKRFLGFGLTEVVATTGTVSFSPIELVPGKSMEVYRSGSEYFLVEYRLSSAATYDQFLPQSAGLAVWHVDDTVVNDPQTFNNNAVNSSNRFGHKGVDLVEADGTPVNTSGGDLGKNNGFVVGQTISAPATNLFDGSPSSFIMSDIAGVGGPSVTADLFFRAEKTSQSVSHAISYPNPSNGNSTFRIHLTRHPAALTAVLYTLLGERVLSVPKDNFIDQGNNEWIFEYRWNGRDETGADVASGVYYLQFDADGQKIRKSIVVQR